MKKADNREVLKFFEKTDLIKYYYDCMNIENAGQSKTAVKSIAYYTATDCRVKALFRFVKIFLMKSLWKSIQMMFLCSRMFFVM